VPILFVVLLFLFFQTQFFPAFAQNEDKGRCESGSKKRERVQLLLKCVKRQAEQKAMGKQKKIKHSQNKTKQKKKRTIEKMK